MPLEAFMSLSSWSVESGYLAYDDSRISSDGVWYFRDMISRKSAALQIKRASCPSTRIRLSAGVGAARVLFLANGPASARAGRDECERPPCLAMAVGTCEVRWGFGLLLLCDDG